MCIPSSQLSHLPQSEVEKGLSSGTGRLWPVAYTQKLLLLLLLQGLGVSLL